MDAVTFRDRATLVGDALVLADVHLGADAASNVELPLGERADVGERVAALLAQFDPAEVVVAGDLLHSFSHVPRSAADALEDLARAVREAGARLVVVRGNHDTMLDSVWDGPTETAYRVGDAVVCHGHERPEREAALYVVGHDHPTIDIQGQRRPCWLYGEGVFRGSDVLMCPAFTRLAAGVEVNGMRARDFQSPLVTDVDAFRPVVRDEAGDETLTFPPLGELRPHL